MRRLLCFLIILFALALPVSAENFTAPTAPESAEDLMPADTESFAEGVWQIVTEALTLLQPEIAKAGRICLSLIAILLLISMLKHFPGDKGYVVEFAAAVGVGAVLLSHSNTLIRLGSQTVTELSEYGKLLLPVMTGALAAQGGTTSAAALYAGTAAFDAVLCSLIGNVLVPMVYMFLALAAAAAATGVDGVGKLKSLVKWLTSWALKLVLYGFTGYMGITGAVSGTADAAAVKAAKLTISSMVPVVGGILSDASETVIVGAGVVKNAAGIYGVLAALAIWITPFLQIGLQYLMLKLTGAVCSVFDLKRVSGLIEDFSSAMGLLLGMTGTVLVLLLVSTICFMKVVA